MSWGYYDPPPTEEELLADVRREIITLVVLGLLFLASITSLVYGWFPVFGSLASIILNGVLLMKVWNDLTDSRELLNKHYPH